MPSLTARMIALAGALSVLTSASQALAWGSTGHRLIGQIGMASLPDEVPAFLRTPDAVKDIGELAREPDRWRGSGKTHDTARDRKSVV